jgi:hypothetical protein
MRKMAVNDYNNNYNFLLQQAREIRANLEAYCNEENPGFRRLLANDLICLAVLAVQPGTPLSDAQIFFMTMVLLPLHPDIAEQDKELIGDITKAFELEHVHDINGFWPKIARFFPENRPEPDCILPTIDYLKNRSGEKAGIPIADIRIQFLRFSRCLINAGGGNPPPEQGAKDRLHSLLFGN